MTALGTLGTGFLLAVAMLYGMRSLRSRESFYRKQFWMIMGILVFEFLSVLLVSVSEPLPIPPWMMPRYWPFWVMGFTLYPAFGLAMQKKSPAPSVLTSAGRLVSLLVPVLSASLFAIPGAAGVLMASGFMVLAFLIMGRYEKAEKSMIPATSSLCFILVALGTILGVVSQFLPGSNGTVLFAGSVVTVQLSGVLIAFLMLYMDSMNQTRTEEDVDQVRAELVFRMTHDSITGLLNRSSFLACLESEQSRYGQARLFSHALYMDIDHFHEICDGLGPHKSDLFLRRVADVVSALVPEKGQLFHMGEDKFMLLMPAAAGADAAGSCAMAVRDALARPLSAGGVENYLTVSIGIDSLVADDGSPRTCDEVMRNLDLALAVAKLDRNTFRFFVPGMVDRGISRLQMANYLRYAISREELSLHFQPQVDSAGRVTGAEALLRWNNPVLGDVPPATFIGVAEESGLIIPVGEWVIEHACIELAHWRDLGMDIPLSVNVSPRQFKDPHFEHMLTETVKAHGLSPQSLHLEITESSVLEENSDTHEVLWSLNRRGFHIHIDDFGTGYANLSYLKRLPVSALKIDRSFISGILENTQDFAVLQAICSMARSLGLKTIAEGVDQEAQMTALLDMECSAIQGYLYSRPVPSGDFILFCRNCA